MDASGVNWRGLAVAGAAAIGGAGLLYSYSQYRKEKKTRAENRKNKIQMKQQREAERKIAGVSSSTAGKQVVPEQKKTVKPKSNLPNDDVLVMAVGRSLQSMQMTQKLDGVVEKSILEWFHQINIEDYQSKSRILLAQWMVVYHQLQSATALGSGQDLKSISKGQEKDMLRTWKLLQVPEAEGDGDMSSAKDLLQLDVAQRLKDKDKISTVYNRIQAREMTDEETLVMFTVAPIMGRWKDVRTLGDKLESMGNASLEEFHMAAQQRPDLPDYHVLYNLAEEKAKGEDTPLNSLRWGKMPIKSIRIKLQPGDLGERAQMLDEYKDWKSAKMPGGEGSLIRMGAVSQMMNLYECSGVLSLLVGPGDDQHIFLQGYTDLNSTDGRLRQTETMELDNSAPDAPDTALWKGTYTILIQAGQTEVQKVVFDVEATVGAFEQI